MATTQAQKTRSRVLRVLSTPFSAHATRLALVRLDAQRSGGVTFSLLTCTARDGSGAEWDTVSIGFSDGSVLVFNDLPQGESERAQLGSGDTTLRKIMARRLKAYRLGAI